MHIGEPVNQLEGAVEGSGVFHELCYYFGKMANSPLVFSQVGIVTLIVCICIMRGACK